ncbi:hypothetical protein [Agromyces mariniharenae]|uniref:Uncharacterized protein n=1 Tax=Agromyces mariniharenae TaxID=2604423 RepID=A0A5S4UUT0_9MICO|nr:hypothetical protein [Agromyces mariniharenae]TYL50306.1 hypothetical protein FYC51_13885 [Agromyces mariniharenae]
MIAAALPALARAATEQPDEEFDPNTVTPGVWGFVLTFLIMVVVVLLVLDMVRRIRRVNYRAEVREQLEAERLEQELIDGGLERDPLDDVDGTDATGRRQRDGRPAASDDDEPPAR